MMDKCTQRKLYTPWWSPEPPWKYTNGTHGLAHLHSGFGVGVFNLAWLSAGISGPVAEYRKVSSRCGWTLTEAGKLTLAGKPLIWQASMLDLVSFCRLVVSEPADWKFDSMDSEKFLTIAKGRV